MVFHESQDDGSGLDGVLLTLKMNDQRTQIVLVKICSSLRECENHSEKQINKHTETCLIWGSDKKVRTI